jgi:glutamine synthetase
MAKNGVTNLRPIEEVVGLLSGDSAKASPAVELASIQKCETPKDVVEYAKKRGLVMVDYKFTDLFGRWHHFSTPITHVSEDIFEEGLGFDGSSIRAFQDIHESDMVLFPDASTAVVDPMLDVPTLSLTCNIYNPESLTPYNKDPRWVAIKAERFLAESKIADISYWGPEAEFFVFDGVSFDYQQRGSHFAVESDLGPWEQGRGENARWGSNLGYRPQAKGGYFRVPPVDKLQDWRSEAVLRMMAVGINVEAHHGEVASSQQEIDLRFSTLVNMGDQMHWYKYILKNVAASYGKTVTFMPKRCSKITATVCTATRACGRVTPTCSTSRAHMPTSARWRAGTSAGLSSTRPPCWRLWLRRPTATSVWFPASKHR